MLYRKKIIAIFLSIVSALCVSKAGAQVPVAAGGGPSDSFYRQSEMLRSFDDAWLPSSSSNTVHNSVLHTSPDSSSTERTADDPSAAGADSQNTPQDFPSHSNRFHWYPALMESLLYTGIMHTFDLTTEAGTRDTLNGPLVPAIHPIRV